MNGNQRQFVILKAPPVSACGYSWDIGTSIYSLQIGHYNAGLIGRVTAHYHNLTVFRYEVSAAVGELDLPFTHQYLDNFRWKEWRNIRLCYRGCIGARRQLC